MAALEAKGERNLDRHTAARGPALFGVVRRIAESNVVDKDQAGATDGRLVAVADADVQESRRG